MNRDTIELIENLTQDIVNIYNLGMPIKDINNVVEILGGELIITSDIDSGLYKTNYGFRIVAKTINKFSIAQELGHLFLHMRYNIDKAYWQKIPVGYHVIAVDISIDAIYEVNRFAEALLMPREIYKEKIEQLNTETVDIYKIAKYFEVTPRQAYERGRRLKLLK